MKKLLPLFSLLLIFSFGCEDEKADQEPEVHELVGVYDLVSTSLEILSQPTQTYSFNADGSETYLTLIFGEDNVYSLQGKVDGTVVSEGGTWSTTSNKLTLVITNTTIGEPDTEIWDYTLTGNNFHMEITTPETDTDWAYIISYDFTKQ